jgi:hypothetical protein
MVKNITIKGIEYAPFLEYRSRDEAVKTINTISLPARKECMEPDGKTVMVRRYEKGKHIVFRKVKRHQ